MDSRLSTKNSRHALLLYIILAGLFIASLTVCNLIANKFITLDLGFYTFVLSAGVLPYPITFLITDFLSEFYGQRRTNYVIISGLISLFFVLFVIWLGSQFTATLYLHYCRVFKKKRISFNWKFAVYYVF